jgi:hypothetical protein
MPMTVPSSLLFPGLRVKAWREIAAVDMLLFIFTQESGGAFIYSCLPHTF